MSRSNRVDATLQPLLLGLLAFGTISALAGGILGVVANGAGVPLSYLDGSPFTSYAIPGILLGVVIGGTQLLAWLAVWRKHRLRFILAVIAGSGMLIWIFAELAVLTQYSVLQSIYFALGGLELLAVFGLLGLMNPATSNFREKSAS